MLRSRAQRGVSKHEAATDRAASSFETRCYAPLLRMRRSESRPVAKSSGLRLPRLHVAQEEGAHRAGALHVDQPAIDERKAAVERPRHRFADMHLAGLAERFHAAGDIHGRAPDVEREL